jgi:hypothetical protein
LPDIYERLHINGWYAIFTLPVLRVAVFFLPREAMILALWRGLVQRLNVQVSEVELIPQYSV